MQPQASPALYTLPCSTVFSQPSYPSKQTRQMAYARSAFMAVDVAMPGQADCSYGYRFCRMPKLSGHCPARPFTPSPWPGAQRPASVDQSPSVPCCHQLSMAACASTRSSSIPHLQAAQRRIWRVVPVNCPSTRGPMTELARASSPLMKPAPMWCPVTWFAARFAPLLSGYGFWRTHAAHCAPDGSAAPGGLVVKRAGAALDVDADRDALAETNAPPGVRPGVGRALGAGPAGVALARSPAGSPKSHPATAVSSATTASHPTTRPVITCRDTWANLGQHRGAVHLARPKI